MRILPVVCVAAVLFAGPVHPARAGPFECPVKPLEGARAAKVEALLPTGDACDDVGRLDGAAAALKTAGVSPALVVDGLVAAYCPVIAPEAGLTDAIILDVALPPAMVEAIDARAKAAGVSPDAWIEGTVAAALR